MKKLLLTTLGALAMTIHAQALLTGGFSIIGGYIPRDAANAPVTDLTQAVKVEFGNAPGTTPDPSVTSGTGTGSFAAIADNTAVTFSALTLQFTPPNTPLIPFFTVDGFRFDLNTIVRSAATSTGLILDGTGIVTNLVGTPDPTPATYSAAFSTVTGKFSYGANVGAIPPRVPEGGSAMALLGMALVGVEALRRKFAA